MRDLARQILRRSGYERHRFLPKTWPDAQLERVLETLAIDLVLAVGANTGQYGHLLRSLGYRGRDCLVRAACRRPRRPQRRRSA